MNKLAKVPYKGYRLYKVFHKKERRYYACLVSVSNPNDRTTVAYAKYLAEVREGKRLGKNRQAHHRDNNKTHDVISNIEVLSAKAHGRRHTKAYRWMVKAKCCVCGDAIYKPYRGKVPRYVKPYLCCSRTCTYKKLTFDCKIVKSHSKIVYGPVLQW